MKLYMLLLSKCKYINKYYIFDDKINILRNTLLCKETIDAKINNI